MAIGATLLVTGVVFGLYGLLLLTYEGEGGSGETYITLSGTRVDAQWAGGIVLPVALVLIACGVWLLATRRRDIANPS